MVEPPVSIRTFLPGNAGVPQSLQGKVEEAGRVWDLARELHGRVEENQPHIIASIGDETKWNRQDNKYLIPAELSYHRKYLI